MKGVTMSLAQAEAHQRKHGFLKGGDASCQFQEQKSGIGSNAALTFKPKRAAMNKTEAEYALILEAMKRKGEILRYEYEGITLRWADMKYTPDFVVFLNNAVAAINGLKLIEIKGAHIWDRDLVRFKGARAYWPEFAFEMWQRKVGTWTRIS